MPSTYAEVAVFFLSYLLMLFLITPISFKGLGTRVVGLARELVVIFAISIPLIWDLLIIHAAPWTLGMVAQNLMVSLGIGFSFGISLILVEYFVLDSRLMLSEEVQRMTRRVDRNFVIRRVPESLIIFPLLEEAFYRGTGLFPLSSLIGFYFGIPLITMMFYLQHRLDVFASSRYSSSKNKAFLVFQGLGLAMVAYVTGDLFACIVAHSLSNVVYAYSRIQKYRLYNDT